MDNYITSAFQIRVLREILGSETEVEGGYWSRLHNEILNNVYSSSSIIRAIKGKNI
jgi:hypothetical protein